MQAWTTAGATLSLKNAMAEYKVWEISSHRAPAACFMEACLLIRSHLVRLFLQLTEEELKNAGIPVQWRNCYGNR